MGYHDEDYDYDEEEYYDEDDIIEKALEIRTKQIVAETRNHLKKEIDSLKSELSKYKDIKENYDKFVKEKEQLAERKEELEEEYQNKLDNLEREFYRKKIYDLIPEKFFDPLYHISVTSIEQKKCPLCDENREYTITTPDGKKHKIPCKCKKYISKYIVQEGKDKILYIYKDYDKDIYSKLRLDIGDEFLWKIELNNKILDKFDETNPPARKWDVYFTSKEEAQKYADYLNKKGEEKNR